jgi:hypothetical protein
MEAAMTWAAATEAERTAGEPLSPELVLVSPDLRERALRELTFPHERNGAGPPAVRLLELARDHHPQTDDEVEVSLLRAAGDALLHVAALGVVLVLVVAGMAFGLTIGPEEPRPELASRPALHPASPGIGTAVAGGDVSVERQPGRAPDRWRRSPGPIGLTREGQLVVIGADGSSFRLSRRSTAPSLRAHAVPLRLRDGYISCGRHRWVAAGANGALSCERETARPGR